LPSGTSRSASVDPASAEGLLVTHVAHVCSPRPDGATCTLDLLDDEESTAEWAWAFAPSASTVRSVRPAAGRLRPGEWATGVEVEVTQCPALLVLVDRERGHVHERDLCLE
jgi:hypothetical protein